MKNQKGFIEFPVLIGIVAVIVVLAGGAYFVMHQNAVPQIPAPQVQTNITDNTQTTTNTNTQNQTSSQTDETINWKTYTSTAYGYQFKYPGSTPPAVVDAKGRPATEKDGNLYISGVMDITLVNALGKCSDLRTEQTIVSCLGPVSWAKEDRLVPVTIGDLPAVQREITLKPSPPIGSDIASVGYIYYLNHGNTGFQISGPDSISDQHLFDQILSTFKFTAPDTTSNTISVPGMTQYTDSSFGFSFWYPSVWNVQQQDASSASNISGAVVVKQITARDENGAGVIIDEVSSSSAAAGITDTSNCGPIDGCPSSIRYYFNTPTHTWMLQKMFYYPNVPGLSEPDVIAPADISTNTMGGLHVLWGNARFGSDVIIPLSARNFLVVKSADPGGTDEGVLAKTILATDPAVATPVSVSQQTQTIQAEAKVYNGQ